MRIEDSSKPRLLIIDDDSAISDLLGDLLGETYDCTTADCAEKAISILERESFDLVLSDINMGAMSGIELIPRIRELAPKALVMMISGEQNIESAISAQFAMTALRNAGAHDTDFRNLGSVKIGIGHCN